MGQTLRKSDEMKKLTRVQKKKRRQKRFFRIILLIAMIALVLTFIFESGFFIINSINIDGNDIISDEEIMNTSNIDLGNHILNYKKNKVEDRLRNFAYI